MRLFPPVPGGCAKFYSRLLKLFCQRFPVLVILILQNDSEFIPANPEHRAVLEYTANQLAGRFYVNIALIMPILVVNLLQVIAVKYADGKRKRLFLVQPFLQCRNIIGKSAAVPDGSQRINKYALVQVVDKMLLFQNLLFCPYISQ